MAEGARFCPTCGAAAPATGPAAGAIGSTVAASAASMVAVAREIAGRYRLFEKLGEGAMGAVFRAEQISLRRTVAVKLLKPALSADRMLVRRFITEAEAIAKLGHPNTVNIYDFGQDADGSLFIVMEYVDGQSMRRVLDAEAPFSPTRALTIAAQVAASLADAHSRSIVHRDLKPDNVMLQTRGRQRDIVRVLDFGIAKLREDNRATRAAMTQAGDLLGTPQYMAPEQVLGEAIDGRTDIYALGCMIYEMVTARRPFDATSVTEMLTKHLNESVVPPTARRPELAIPVEVDRLVLMAMMKQPVARPPTMELFGEQIAAVLAMLPREAERGSSEVLPAARGASSSSPLAIYATPPAGSQQYMSPMATPLPPVGALPTPPLGHPPVAASSSAVASSPRSGLYIALGLAAIALIGGGVWFALRKPASESPAPSPSPSVSPQVAVASVDAQLAVPPPPPTPPPVIEQPGVLPTAPSHPSPVASTAASHPPGELVEAVQGVKLVVPPGFKVQRQHGNLVARATGYTIVVGPITTKLHDPEAAAQEYATATGLTLDGVVPIELGGVKRSGAAFHGMLYGEEVSQSIISFTGPKYRVAVSLTMPYAARNDPQVRAFADDLFAHRVITP